MRVTPEQSRRVQEICFENNIFWKGDYNKDKINLAGSFLYIENSITHDVNDTESELFFREYDIEEIDADLFIRTNGTCKEKNSGIDYETLRVSHLVLNSKYEELEQKLKKKNEILKKARIKRKNQREELNKLNIKLQKCISLEEHRSIVDKLNKENIEMGRLVNLNASALVLVGQTKDLAMQKIEEQAKEIEKLKAVIEYLESKLKGN